jgi:hypothetical protein
MKRGFSVSVVIRAERSEVFWCVADPSNAPRIDPAVVRYEPDGGTMGLGVRNHIRVKMLGVPLNVTSETIDWAPPERMGFRSIKPARPTIGVATHLFSPCPGGTLYTWSMDFVPTGTGGLILAVAGSALLRRNAVAQQERVREMLETASPR